MCSAFLSGQCSDHSSLALLQCSDSCFPRIISYNCFLFFLQIKLKKQLSLVTLIFWYHCCIELAMLRSLSIRVRSHRAEGPVWKPTDWEHVIVNIEPTDLRPQHHSFSYCINSGQFFMLLQVVPKRLVGRNWRQCRDERCGILMNTLSSELGIHWAKKNYYYLAEFVRTSFHFFLSIIFGTFYWQTLLPQIII